MSEHMSNSLQRRYRITELEYDIRRMEVDLDCCRDQAKLIEEAINEKQRHLDRLQHRLRPSRVMEEDHDTN
ncbi:hypothetical protein NsoK4_08135 [Nitrosopumilus sp. K4]|uniref:hypothetical protein n=1 Tax=Nitrosopumilus sp. K4 TaxID=2795383 RepID=UPI001BA7A826|nr:hypothetical protein [Nitrosopumilus sp. K4]QUC64384.1 hypothetical protein NsoK4_08135 [Nitrosopumilus sp. K4]